MKPPEVTVIAGIPAQNTALYWAIRFSAGDPAAFIDFGTGGVVSVPSRGSNTSVCAVARTRRILIVRDIEMERARRSARVDSVHSPSEFTPDGGFASDRETATAQALAECLRRADVKAVRADRTLALVYAEQLRLSGIAITYDADLAVAGRRCKDEQEIAWLGEAQAATERAIRMACETVARAQAQGDGVLLAGSEPLNCELLRRRIDLQLLAEGYDNPVCIVASGPRGADCHDRGSGVIRTGEPVIIDVFPLNRTTLYSGDCTRCVVHGAVPDQVCRMHAAVLAAKRAAIAATRAGVTGESIHAVTAAEITRAGYQMGMPPKDAPDSWCGMVHGTGHGIGLSVHEQPLLDKGGPALVEGDAITIEPGLYCKAIGGIRIEDMVIVTKSGCMNLNTLPESLEWC